MSRRICENCKSTNIRKDKYIDDGSDCYVCEECCRVGTADEFPEYTVFHQITSSLEVLAEKLVYKTYDVVVRTWDTEKDDWGTADPTWRSVILDDDGNFTTKAEAIAATIEKLKEVNDA